MATETIPVTAQGLTISVIVWRRFRRRKTGFVERVLALNPGVSDAGAFLPVGTLLVLPVETKQEPILDTAYALWD